jgi:hypothetical protein
MRSTPPGPPAASMIFQNALDWPTCNTGKPCALAQDGRSETDVTDDAAYQHLKDEEMKLPAQKTWTRYLGLARNALRQQKRKLRPKYVGPSAVPPEHFGDRGDD